MDMFDLLYSNRLDLPMNYVILFVRLSYMVTMAKFANHLFMILYTCILSHIVISLSLSRFRLCVACQCLKHLIVFLTLVTL
jgi:hypothetical protein